MQGSRLFHCKGSIEIGFAVCQPIGEMIHGVMVNGEIQSIVGGELGHDGSQNLPLIEVGGELFCDQKETTELRYFSKENKPQLFTKSHDDLWDDIFR